MCQSVELVQVAGRKLFANYTEYIQVKISTFKFCNIVSIYKRHLE
jgi:hypothetical protein